MKIIYINLLILAMLTIGCGNRPAQDEILSDKEPTAFVKGKITTGPLETTVLNNTIECTGKIEIPPSDVHSVHSRAQGYVQDLTKLPGDRVQKGEVLLEIENPDFIGMQRQAYELRHQYNTARTQYLRQKELNEKSATTAKQFEQALGTYRVNRSNYLGLIMELESIGLTVDTSSNTPQYQRTIIIRSPIRGQVSSVKTNMGKYIESHDELLTITSEEHIHLELFILERDIDMVSVGQSVRFTTTSTGNVIHGAEIVKINSVADRNSGTVMAHCHIDPDGTQFKGGTFAQAKIDSSPTESTALPREAVISVGNTWYGFIVTGDEYVQVELPSAAVHGDHIVFEPTPAMQNKTWVTGGAYYIQ